MAPRTPPGTFVQNISARVAAATQAAITAFSTAPLSPGTPPRPDTLGDKESGPRQFEFSVGQNLAIGPRSEGQAYTAFDLLRQLARNYSVSRICIARRIEKAQAVKWTIVPRSKDDASSLQPRIERATTFFQSPDREHTFSDWLALALRDMFEIDAMTIYRHLDNAGDLWALEVVDGSTIKPVLDIRGRVSGYQQVLYGFARSEYERAANVSDDPPAGVEDESSMPIYPVGDEDQPRQLYYMPRYVSVDSPYGSPPIEWVLTEANTAIRKKLFELAFFTDGNTPDMFGVIPNDRLTPQQIMDAEDAYNAYMRGNDRARRALRFLPFNMNIIQTRPFSYDRSLDDQMMRLTCAGYNITPMEIGYTETVNKSSGGTQENVSAEAGLKPLMAWLKDFFDDILARDFDLAEAQWQWNTDGLAEDTLKQAQADKLYVDMGAAARGEIRTLRFGDDLTGPPPPMDDIVAYLIGTKEAAPALPPAPPTQQEQPHG